MDLSISSRSVEASSRNKRKNFKPRNILMYEEDDHIDDLLTYEDEEEPAIEEEPEEDDSRTNHTAIDMSPKSHQAPQPAQQLQHTNGVGNGNSEPKERKSPVATPPFTANSVSIMNPLLPPDSLLHPNSLVSFLSMTNALKKPAPRPVAPEPPPPRRALSSWKTGLALNPGPGTCAVLCTLLGDTTNAHFNTFHSFSRSALD